MNIELREITSENWEDCVDLSVNDDQKNFVAPNWYSLLQSKFETDISVLAIYDENEEMVGFLMYDNNPDYKNSNDPRMEMSRLMIDKKHQKKGYGKMAVGKLLNLIRTRYGGIKFYTSIEPGNVIAEKLYESFGFRKTGEVEYDELVLMVQL